MLRFVQGSDRDQVTLLPECLNDYIAEDNFGNRQPFFESPPPRLGRKHRGCGLRASLFRLRALSCRCERRDT